MKIKTTKFASSWDIKIDVAKLSKVGIEPSHDGFQRAKGDCVEPSRQVLTNGRIANWESSKSHSLAAKFSRSAVRVVF